jgi:hypothetical protein
MEEPAASIFRAEEASLFRWEQQVLQNLTRSVNLFYFFFFFSSPSPPFYGSASRVAINTV